MNDISGTEEVTAAVPGPAAGKRARRVEPVVATEASPAPSVREPAQPAVDAVTPSQGRLEPGRRRASRPARTASRGPLFKGLPSLPVAAGVAALAVSIGGATFGPGLGDSTPEKVTEASTSLAVSEAATDALAERDAVVSRDSRRDAQVEAQEKQRAAEAEKAAKQREQKLETLNLRATKQAAKVEANRWHLPVKGYRLTATFGLSSSLWSTVHTGLDFAGPSGSPLLAVANGTITETGWAGAYGNRTILTLENGTEIWYCHQSSIDVTVGQKVAGGDMIGRLGSTGNSTGPHLHFEVRPGGGDPVNPYSVLTAHGVRP